MARRAPSHSITSLEEVQAQLTAWRSGSQRARRIPDDKVPRALGLDCKALRARTLKVEQTRPPRAFVELAPLWAPGEVLIECQDSHHGRLRVHCKGPLDPQVVDLVKGFFGRQR